jgi:hypothetical protein
MIVEKAAEEPVEFFVENQLSGEKDRIRKLMRDFETQMLQLHHDVRPEAGSQFRMKA